MLSGKILPAKLVKASKYEEPLRGSQGRLTVKSNLGGGVPRAVFWKAEHL